MSVEKSLEIALKNKKERWIPSGELQRRDWFNNDGTLAVPRSVVRRLQEMQNDSVIAVRFVGRKRTPEYRWIPHEWRSRYIPSHAQGVDGKWQAPKPATTLPLLESPAPIVTYKDEDNVYGGPEDAMDYYRMKDMD